MSYLKEKLEIEAEELELKAQYQLMKFPPFYRWMLVIGALALVPAYFGARAFSHDYWQKKLHASLISAKPSYENPKPIRAGKTAISTHGEDVYAVAIEIENQNLDLAVRDVPVTVELQDRSGLTVHSEQRKIFLLPGERKYIVLPKVKSKEKLVSATILLPPEISWQKRQNIPKVNITTSPPRTRNVLDPVSFEVSGGFTNKSPYSIKDVHLSVLLYNKQGQIVGASVHDAQSIRPLETRDYKLTWPGVYSTDIDYVDVIPEVDVLNPENLSLPQQPAGSAADLGRPEQE